MTAEVKLSAPAEADVARILATSAAQWGEPARERYEHLLKAAMRLIAENPRRRGTVDCGDVRPGMRRLHTRLARAFTLGGPVRSPVHVIYYREAAVELVEIVRVLHERMDPVLHFGE